MIIIMLFSYQSTLLSAQDLCRTRITLSFYECGRTPRSITFTSLSRLSLWPRPSPPFAPRCVRVSLTDRHGLLLTLAFCQHPDRTPDDVEQAYETDRDFYNSPLTAARSFKPWQRRHGPCTLSSLPTAPPAIIDQTPVLDTPVLDPSPRSSTRQRKPMHDLSHAFADEEASEDDYRSEGEHDDDEGFSIEDDGCSIDDDDDDESFNETQADSLPSSRVLTSKRPRRLRTDPCGNCGSPDHMERGRTVDGVYPVCERCSKACEPPET